MHTLQRRKSCGTDSGKNLLKMCPRSSTVDFQYLLPSHFLGVVLCQTGAALLVFLLSASEGSSFIKSAEISTSIFTMNRSRNATKNWVRSVVSNASWQQY